MGGSSLLVSLLRARPYFAAAALVAVALGPWLAAATPRRPSAPCRFEQRWSAGTAYDHEDLSFSPDGGGYWARGDRHGDQEVVRFRWSREGERLTVAAGAERRAVSARTARRREGRADVCVLTLGASPVASAGREFFGE
ncbi:MAG: hypothetical protein U0324_04070 [Polyangiales bacterium]